MAIKTTLEQIEEVQSAISNVMDGQEVSVAGGKRLTLADLSALEKREERLLARYRQENGQGLSRNYGIMRRN